MKPTVLKYGTGYDLVVAEEDSRPHREAWHTRLILGIRCKTCQRISFHPKDITERYCGNCKVFHEDSLLAHEG